MQIHPRHSLSRQSQDGLSTSGGIGGGGERERESEREGMRESVGGLKLKSVGLKDMRWEERKRDYR
jgi:hypothetical protein